MKKKILFAWALIIGIIGAAKGQDSQTDGHTISITVPEVALVDVEPSASNSISLEYSVPTEAGLAISGASNSDLWLNYSSIKSTANPTRTVSVKLSSVIEGANLKVSAAADAGSGDGTIGSPGAELTLSTSDQILVSGIGSCYTGDGSGSGHNLTYTLDVGTYADLEAVSGSSLTVTYTISN